MRSAKETFQHFVTQLLKNSKLPLWASLLVSFFANLQILYLILQPTFNNTYGISLRTLKFLRKAATYTVGSNIYALHDHKTFLKVMWFVAAVYLVLISIFTLNLLWKYCKGCQDIYPRLCKPFARLLLIHSKLIFCPIHYFLIWILSTYNKCDSEDEQAATLPLCHPAYFAITFPLCLLNLGLAVFKEFFAYQTRQSKDQYASKNNLFHQNMLVHKTVLVVFIMALSDVETIHLAFNLLFSLVYCFNMLRSFPFYNIYLLKANIIYASVHFTFALFTFSVSFKSGQKYLEVLVVVMSVFFTKCGLLYSRHSLNRIFQLDFRTPDEALHVLPLLKYSTINYSMISKINGDYKKGSFYFYGLLQALNIDCSNVKEYSTLKDYNSQLYGTLLLKLGDLSRKYPHSELLTLLIIQVNIKKLANVARAVILLNKLKASNPSMQTQITIAEIYSKLETMYKRMYTMDELDTLKYFNYREQAIELKVKLQKEIKKHLKVWKDISDKSLDARGVLETAEKIESENQSALKIWKKSSGIWGRNFIAPYLMYGLYLSIVRKDLLLGEQILKKYHDLKRYKKQFKNGTTGDHSDSAIILASIEIDKPGVIIDASSSVSYVFNIEKDMLIGQKIDLLLPKFLRKPHENLIKNFSMSNKHDLNKVVDSYARNSDGVIFPVQVKLKIYPYLNKGLNIVTKIKRLKDRELIMVIDQDGFIAECSDEVCQVLKLSQNDYKNTAIEHICPEFIEFNNAVQFLSLDKKEAFENDVLFPVTEDDFPSNAEFEFSKEKPLPVAAAANSSAEQESEAVLRSQTRLVSNYLNDTTRNGLLSERTDLQRSVFTRRHLAQDTIFDQAESVRMRLYKSKKIAAEICKKFQNGVCLRFFIKADNLISITRSSKMTLVQMEVIVDPVIIDGSVYKIIKIKKISTEQRITSEFSSSPPTRRTNRDQTKETAAFDEFEDNFPTVHERTEEEDDIVEEKVIYIKESQKQILMGKKTFEEEEQQQPNTNSKITSNHLDQSPVHYRTVKRPDDMPYEASTSKKTSSHKEIRIVKALNNLFDKKSMRSSTRLAVFIVYLAMLAVITLVSLEHVYADKSSQSLKNGANIVSTASYRILNMMVAWEYILVIYARALNLKSPTTTSSAQVYIENATLSLISYTEELQTRIQNSGQSDLLETYFEKRYSLWLPAEKKIFEGGVVDTFTASNIISNMNLNLAATDGTASMVVGQESSYFILNNTCNDLLLQSENQVDATESIVSDIISTNQSLVILLLVLEIVAIFMVIVALLFVVWVTTKPYKNLFKVLRKLGKDAVDQRIAELNAVKECLEKNIEVQEVIVKAELYLDKEQRHEKIGGEFTKSNHARNQERENFSLASLYRRSFRILSASILLIFCMAGLFLATYFISDSTFNNLKITNDRLSLAHQLGYTFDLLVGAFYYTVIFQNETNYLWRYVSPTQEFETTLDYLSNANEKLLAVLPDPETGEIDPYLQSFLTSDVCPFLSVTAIDMLSCQQLSKQGALGLLGLNNQYYQNTNNYFNQYLADPTFDAASDILNNYVTAIKSALRIIPKAYEFLRTYLLEDFNESVEDQRKEGLMLYLILLIGLVASIAIIQFVTINRLQDFDIGIKIILKLIPFNMIQENRLLGFYFKTEFKKELEDIKDFY